YLGPVIRAKKGEEVTVHIQNDLGEEETTVHWHGLEIPGDVDGGPHQVIAPDESMTTKFTISQRAATLRSEEHTSELQSRFDIVCRLLLEKKKNKVFNQGAS